MISGKLLQLRGRQRVQRVQRVQQVQQRRVVRLGVRHEDAGADDERVRLDRECVEAGGGHKALAQLAHGEEEPGERAVGGVGVADVFGCGGGWVGVGEGWEGEGCGEGVVERFGAVGGAAEL